MAKKAKAIARGKKAVAKKRVTKKPVILPRKLSALIGIALKDIRKAEKLKNKYVLNMGTWFDKDEVVCRLGDESDGDVISRHKVCVICAAGSVMAFSLGADKRFDDITSLDPHHFDGNSRQLQAIDDLRQGWVDNAASWIDVKLKGDPRRFDTVIPRYDAGNPEPFHAAMAKMQAKLAKAGY